MRIIQSLLALDRTLTPEKLLRLEMNIDEDDMELPTIWYVTAKLFHIWSCRATNKRAKLYTIRVEVETRVALLKETQFGTSADKVMGSILNIMI